MVAIFTWVDLCAWGQTAAPANGAQPRHYELAWHAPKGCPEQGALVREIDELIAESSGISSTASILAEALITPDRDGFALALSLRDGEASRSRHIGAPTCEELGHATALIIAMAIDPTILERHTDLIGPAGNVSLSVERRCSYHCRLTDLLAPNAPSRTPQSREVVATAQPRPAPAAAEPLFWRLGLGTYAAIGVLPGVNPGWSILGAVQGRAARLELSASILSASVESPTVQSRSAEFDLYRMTPRGCWLVTKRLWAFGPCASVDIGLLEGKGRGVTNFHTKSALWLAGATGALVELRLGASSVVAVSADLSVPFSHRFELVGEQLFDPKISGNFGLSLAAGWQ